MEEPNDEWPRLSWEEEMRPTSSDTGETPTYSYVRHANVDFAPQRSEPEAIEGGSRIRQLGRKAREFCFVTEAPNGHRYN